MEEDHGQSPDSYTDRFSQDWWKTAMEASKARLFITHSTLFAPLMDLPCVNCLRIVNEDMTKVST